MSAGLSDYIAAMVDEWRASTKAMSADCRDTNGLPRCYICGRSDGLRCMIRGWGGVWACSTCLTEAVAS